MAEGITLPVKKDQAIVEEGFYEAVFTDYETVDDGQWGPQLKLFWTITDEGEVKGSVLSSFVKIYAHVSPRMKLHEITSALLPADPQEGDVLDLDALINSSCRIRVEVENRDDGSTYSKVAAYSRLKSTSGQPQSGHPHLNAFIEFCRSNGLANPKGELQAEVILGRLGVKVPEGQTTIEAFTAYRKAIGKRKKVQGDDEYRVIIEELVSAIGLTAPEPEEVPFE